MDKFKQKLGLCWESPGKGENKRIKHRIQRSRLKEDLKHYLRKESNHE